MALTKVGQVDHAIAALDPKLLNTAWSKGVRYVVAVEELREHYVAVKAGAEVDECLVIDTGCYIGAEKRAEVRKAFLPYLRIVTCPHCGGDGISRGTDYGMGCGICHGRGEVSAKAQEEVFAHRQRMQKRGIHSRV